MEGKQLTIEDVIRRMNEVMRSEDDPATPTAKKLYVNAAQMAVMRQMMDAGELSNHPPSRHIYEPEEPDEVPQVQRNDNSK